MTQARVWYLATSGCEDALVGCRHARPAAAMALFGFARGTAVSRARVTVLVAATAVLAAVWFVRDRESDGGDCHAGSGSLNAEGLVDGRAG